MSSAADRLFSDVEFVRGVAEPNQLPPCYAPEIAFAGRSNVGKSSLLNALFNRRKLARTSHTPGRTQQLNFFEMGGGRMICVDMPGYGYAKISKAERKRWDRLIDTYLAGRVCLRLVGVLVDARHGLKDSDREMFSLLDEMGVPGRVILTKTDKVKSAALETCIADTKAGIASHASMFPEPLATSSIKNKGFEELRGVIAGLA